MRRAMCTLEAAILHGIHHVCRPLGKYSGVARRGGPSGTRFGGSRWLECFGHQIPWPDRLVRRSSHLASQALDVGRWTAIPIWEPSPHWMGDPAWPSLIPRPAYRPVWFRTIAPEVRTRSFVRRCFALRATSALVISETNGRLRTSPTSLGGLSPRRTEMKFALQSAALHVYSERLDTYQVTAYTQPTPGIPIGESSDGYRLACWVGLIWLLV